MARQIQHRVPERSGRARPLDLPRLAVSVPHLDCRRDPRLFFLWVSDGHFSAEIRAIGDEHMPDQYLHELRIVKFGSLFCNVQQPTGWAAASQRALQRVALNRIHRTRFHSWWTQGVIVQSEAD